MYEVMIMLNKIVGSVEKICLERISLKTEEK